MNLPTGCPRCSRNSLRRSGRGIAGASDARRNELRRLISRRQSALNDDDELERLFSEYIGALPDPPNRVQERRIFGEWEGNLRSELVRWQDELNELENRPVDKRRFSPAHGIKRCTC